MAEYASAVLDRLHARGALGAFWWCWADYDPSLASLPPFDRAPHELRFGIVRSDGSLKPVAERLAAFAREARETVDAAGADRRAKRSITPVFRTASRREYRSYCDDACLIHER